MAKQGGYDMKNKISTLVESYLGYKHSLGFQMTAESVYLRAFARYTQELQYAGPLTRDIVFQWCESGSGLSLVTKGRRFEPLKGLADYANAFDPESELLPRLPYGNPYKRVHPHIYTLEETCLLMERCGGLYSPDGIRALTMRTAIGLLWSTGLRTSELVNLTTSDVDLTNALITVRSSKFNKDRIIPILPDVSGHLRLYREKVEHLSGSAVHEPSFFVTTRGKPLKRNAFEYAFQKIRGIIDVSDSGYGNARLYDFRHSFASRTIRNWIGRDEDADAKLFLLSTYLGHVHPEDTYWYLSSTPGLMELSSRKYENIFGGGIYA